MHGGKESESWMPAESILLSTSCAHFVDLGMVRLSGRTLKLPSQRAKARAPPSRSPLHPKVLPRAALACWAVNQEEAAEGSRRRACPVANIMWIDRTAARERLGSPQRPRKGSNSRQTFPCSIRAGHNRLVGHLVSTARMSMLPDSHTTQHNIQHTVRAQKYLTRPGAYFSSSICICSYTLREARGHLAATSTMQIVHHGQ